MAGFALANRDMLIDVSQHQGVIAWDKVKAHRFPKAKKNEREKGVAAVYLRATMGSAGYDTRATQNAAGCKAQGIPFGVYHLFRSDSPAHTQAAHAIKQHLAHGGVLPLAVDVEFADADIIISPDQYAARLAEFVTIVHRELGYYPVIYTSRREWHRLVGKQHDALFVKCPLWVAIYPNNAHNPPIPTETQSPALPDVWSTYWLWQYTSKGVVSGITNNVDINIAN